MAYCGKCGTQIEEGVKFCPACGAAFRRELAMCIPCGLCTAHV